MTEKYAVRTKGLYKAFHGKEVIRNCALNVEQGSIYGFLGANGAGKTTVFKLLTGLLTPTMGEVLVLGKDITTHKFELLRSIGSLIETPIFYEHLSAKENLEIHLDYMGIEQADTEAALVQVGLPGTGSQPVSEYSLGMRQRLGIARAIIHQPKLLILDEPINGLDPMGIREIRELLKRLAAEKEMTILLSSHILSEIEHIADKIGIIADGTVVQEVMLEDLKNDKSIELEEYFLSVVKGGTNHA